MPKKPKISEEDWRSALALMLVETGVRNSRLEDLHAGISPSTAVGDYSDVKVVTPYGEIPWSRLSRFGDEEMKALMMEVVDRVFTVLTHPEPFMRLGGAARWNKPQLNPMLLDNVARWEARQRGMTEEEVFDTWPIDESKRLPPIRMEQRTDAFLAELEKPREYWSYEATPERLRALAEAPIADAEWIAKAREGLKQAADGWERAHLQTLDEIETATYGQD